MKGVIELTRAKKALSQAVLLISGAVMLGFGAMRGEVETVAQHQRTTKMKNNQQIQAFQP